jgi:phosphatidylglycerol:prolipoprotein diacylglycerol transferase
VSLRSYGVLCGLGLLVGIVVILRAGQRAGLDRRRLVDAVLWILLTAMVGAKVTLLIINIEAYIADPWAWVDFLGRPRRIPRALILWKGGLVYYGGILGGALAAVIYCRLRHVAFGALVDVIAPGLALGHAWGRLGCFLSGCCHGKAGGGSLGVSFGFGTRAYEAHAAAGLLLPPSERTYPLHPVQLYEAAFELLLAAFLFWLLRRRQFRGQVLLAYLSFYGVARFFFEIYRGDWGRGFLGDPHPIVAINRLIGVDGGSPTLLSVSQLASVVILVVCAWMWFLSLHKRARRQGEEPPK